ncbi:MAG: hypothetical protein A4E57_00545 [Syntrophorhabdaceae bacterium PtaU1.Bin034]|nr:MAG: hypothetical protein A4E57_00545 [Syntrophorhabdaceae bacterium PtaU1.Bin034]
MDRREGFPNYPALLDHSSLPGDQRRPRKMRRHILTNKYVVVMPTITAFLLLLLTPFCLSVIRTTSGPPACCCSGVKSGTAPHQCRACCSGLKSNCPTISGPKCHVNGHEDTHRLLEFVLGCFSLMTFDRIDCSRVRLLLPPENVYLEVPVTPRIDLPGPARV